MPAPLARLLPVKFSTLTLEEFKRTLSFCPPFVTSSQSLAPGVARKTRSFEIAPSLMPKLLGGARLKEGASSTLVIPLKSKTSVSFNVPSLKVRVTWKGVSDTTPGLGLKLKV